MNGGFRQISPAGLKLLIDHPDLAPAALDFGLPQLPGAPGVPLSAELAQFLDAFPANQREEMQRRLASSLAELGASGAGLPHAEEADSLSELGLTADDFATPLTIDKAWHGLHFLLTGSADEAPGPLGSVVLGGTPLGEDLAYGPLRYLTPAEVAAGRDALLAVTTDALTHAYSPTKMNDHHVYPGGWEVPENLAWLEASFRSVAGYFANAGERGWAMLLYLT